MTTRGGREDLSGARARPARVDVRLTSEAGVASRLAAAGDHPVRPGAARARRIDVDLADRRVASSLCEVVVFGRAAMGETVRQGRFVDRWRVRRGGTLIFAETCGSTATSPRCCAERAVANGGARDRARSLIAPGDEALARARPRRSRHLQQRGRRVAPGMGLRRLRLCADDARAVAPRHGARACSAARQPLPRIWMNLTD